METQNFVANGNPRPLLRIDPAQTLGKIEVARKLGSECIVGNAEVMNLSSGKFLRSPSSAHNELQGPNVRTLDSNWTCLFLGLRRCWRQLIVCCGPSLAPVRLIIGIYCFAFLAFAALNFVQRSFVAFEIFALAAADITRLGLAVL
jgi:hypothetical protein